MNVLLETRSQRQIAATRQLTHEGIAMTKGVNEPALRALVETAGGRWKGIQEIPGRGPAYVVFNEPQHGSTTMLPIRGLSRSAVESSLRDIRARFAAAAA